MPQLSYEDFAKQIYLPQKRVCVFEGGGVKGASYTGTLQVFCQLDPAFLTRLTHV